MSILSLHALPCSSPMTSYVIVAHLSPYAKYIRTSKDSMVYGTRLMLMSTDLYQSREGGLPVRSGGEKPRERDAKGDFTMDDAVVNLLGADLPAPPARRSVDPSKFRCNRKTSFMQFTYHASISCCAKAGYTNSTGAGCLLWWLPSFAHSTLHVSRFAHSAMCMETSRAQLYF